MPDLHIECIDSADQLRAIGWDDLTGAGDFYLSTAWLRTLSGPSVGQPRFLVGRARGSDDLAATLACYRLDSNSTASAFIRLDQFLARQAASTDTCATDWSSLLPTLVCGGRQLGMSRALTRELRSELRMEWIQALLAAVEHVAQACDAQSIAFLYVTSNDLALRECLRAAGYREFPSDQYHLLDILWSSFDGYLSRFDSHRRSAIRRELRKLSDAGVELVAGQLQLEDIPSLTTLEYNLVQRYRSARSRDLVQATLVKIATHLPTSTLLVTAKHDGTVRGFALFISWRDELYARHVGFDYDFQAKLPLYFATLFYRAAELAPGEGIKRIHYGIASDDAKLSRGCRALAQFAYAKGLSADACAILDRLPGSTGSLLT